MRKIIIINGPNLNLLGTREPHIYGNKSLVDINDNLKKYGRLKEVEIHFFQSNHEGDIIDCIHNSSEYEGIVINPGALMSYSYSLRDAISSVNTPVIEVHISNVFSREAFRHHSVISSVVVGTICGFKELSYRLAIDALQFCKSG